MNKEIEYQQEAELDTFNQNTKSSVKLKNTTRGITWEIKVVTGEKDLINDLMLSALEVHKKLELELNQGGK